MKTLPILFQKTFPGLAKAGEVKQVAASYARNVLLPQGIGVVATPGVQQRQGALARKAAQEEKRRKARDAGLMTKLKDLSAELAATADEQGNLYAAVHAEEIAAALKTQGVEVDAGQIAIPEPIKKTGQHGVTVRIDDAEGPLIVNVRAA